MASGIYRTANGTQPATPPSGYVDRFSTATGQPTTIDSDGVVIRGDHFSYNYVRNSSLWYAQRQAPGTLTTYSSAAGRAFSADGFAITNENASCQFIRVDTQAAPEAGLVARFYGSITKITNTGKFEVSQCIEDDDTASLRGHSVRLRISLKSTTSQTCRLGLIQLTAAGTSDTIPATFISAHGANGTDPTLGANLAYIAPKAGVTPEGCSVVGNALDCSTGTTWRTFSGVFDVPSNAKNLIAMVWTNSQLTATNGFSISEVSLTDDMGIKDFEPLAFPLEAIRVKRYYSKSFADDQNPTTNVGVNSGEYRAIAGKAGAVANSGFIQCQFIRPMRVSPTVVVYNPAAANALARNITGAADMGATAITGTSAQNFYTASTGVAATAVGDLIAIHWSADAEL